MKYILALLLMAPGMVWAANYQIHQSTVDDSYSRIRVGAVADASEAEISTGTRINPQRWGIRVFEVEQSTTIVKAECFEWWTTFGTSIEYNSYDPAHDPELYAPYGCSKERVYFADGRVSWREVKISSGAGK